MVFFDCTMLIYRRTFFSFLAGLLFFAALPGMADTKGQFVSLSWEQPHRYYINDEEYREALYFEKALFADSLPTLPVYHHRVRSPVPHFSYHFQLTDKQFTAVTDVEDAILREAGFRQGSILLHSEMQSARKERYDVVSFYPFRYDTYADRYEKLASFTLEMEHAYDPALQYGRVDRYVENSVLASGSWYKLCVDETGVYRLGAQDLEALGVDISSVQKQNLRLFGNGNGMLPEANDAFVYDDLHENAIYVSGSPTGSFGQDDYLLFYGRSPDRWYLEQHGPDDEGADSKWLFRRRVHLYDTEACYFLTTDQGQGKRIGQQPEASEAVTHQVTSFRDYAAHQRDLSNLLGSGRIWFGEVFDATTSRQFTFDFPHLDMGMPATVEAYLAARSPLPSSFTVNAGGQQKQMNILAINPAAHNSEYVRTVNDFMDFTPDSPDHVTINLTYNRPGVGSRGWLNYLVINADRQLRFTEGQMAFRQVEHIGQGKVVAYILEDAGNDLKVWDVTDHLNISEQQMSQQGGSMQFILPGDTLREFVAFDGTSFLAPSLNGEVHNQNLHAMGPKDMIIVSPEEMLTQAGRLADFRAGNDGLTIGVVTTQQVYNEFSSGTRDISAIRNFMKMFFDRAETPDEMPRYLLLFGNGIYDNKDLLGYGGNLIPTYQSYASLAPRSSYMTDDYYGLLGDHEGEDAFGVVDIGIGRLPVRTPEEAEDLVNKIIRYNQRVPGMEPGEDNLEFTGVVSNYADWRNRVVFIADDGDGNRHFNDSEILANRLAEDHPRYNVKKIYLDAYQQMTMAGGARYPDVNKAINEVVNQGALMINYIGHGGPRGLAHQRILTFDDIGVWNNKYNMPVFMTATCEFSSFDQPDPEELSAGVRIVLKPLGGTAALFTTTRLAWSGNNMTLNRNFMDVAFEKDQEDNNLRMGDLIRIAKRNSSGASIPMQLRNFVLLGDPSMQMAYPEHRVVTETMPDTIKAYQNVTVTGYVTDASGNRLDNYNGVLFPTIYDKEMDYRTLGNNPGSIPADFTMRNAILYKGKASIINGEFSFTFNVPRDIAYNFGNGKISYYMDDGNTDGHGYHQDFVIGGTLDSFLPDTEGPVIELYMNDTTFVSGDHTSENPILLAFLHDESGINMTGSIGRNIVAYLNENHNDPIRLTNYYEADLDNFQSGRVVYPFYGLEDGHHSLSLRAWDTHNNPSSATIEFIVSSTGSIVLGDLMNYPNPFSYDTWFTFKHNQAFNEMDVRIDIYDLQGRLVNTISRVVSSAGYRSEPIHWDGFSNDGRPLGNGIYLYRLTMETPDGKRSRMTEKLVIFR